MIRDNEGKYVNLGRFVRRGSLNWHQNNVGAHNFNCHTIIFYLRKRPKDNVGGNFFWAMDGYEDMWSGISS